MLKYQAMGPDANGLYSVMYPVPGSETLFHVAGQGRTMAQVEGECARLNEEQVHPLRMALRERCNRIVRDLPRDPKGGI